MQRQTKLLKGTLYTKCLVAAITFCCVTCQPAFGQKETPYYPKIGDTIRDHIFTDVLNSNGKKSVNIRDYRGQWLILDVWSRFCSGCIQSFPRMNRLADSLAGKVKLIMIGTPGRENDPDDLQLTKQLYQKQAKMHNLDFTVAFDSSIRPFLDFEATPFIVVIDPGGKIVFKTDHIEINQVKSIMNGIIPINMIQAYSVHETAPYAAHNTAMPLLIAGKQSNGGVDTAFLYRSLLGRWNSRSMKMMRSGLFYNNPVTAKTSECTKVDIFSLLYFVYTGRLEWYPEYEVFDSLIVNSKPAGLNNFKANANRQDNWYFYSISLPADQRSKTNVQKFIAQDLERTFAIRSHLETRKMKCLALVVKDQKTLNRFVAKGGQKDFWENKDLSIRFTNMSAEDLLDWGLGLKINSQRAIEGMPKLLIEDKTNLSKGLDFTLDITYATYGQIIKELNKIGLDLIEVDKEMKCIVVENSDEKIMHNFDICQSIREQSIIN